MPLITFVTAVAPYHSDLLPAAMQSVKAQSIPCEHLIIQDTHGRGAGWARNQGLAQVKTDFTVFLDADDTVTPLFAEKTLKAFDGYHYIYTDFYHNGEVIPAPDVGHFLEGNNQVITTLVPTVWLRAVGGFDESLTGAEDTNLYLRLQAARRCGKRLPEPLFNYGNAGRRAKDFVHGPLYESTMLGMSELRGKAMSCCGENADEPQIQAQPGDVLARAIWGGNRSIYGAVTQRAYPRTGNGKIESVHPADVKAMPHMWQLVEPEPPPEPFIPSTGTKETAFKVAPVVTDVNQVVEAFFGMSPDSRVMTADELRAIQPAKVKPNVAKVTALAKGKGRK